MDALMRDFPLIQIALEKQEAEWERKQAARVNERKVEEVKQKVEKRERERQ